MFEAQTHGSGHVPHVCNSASLQTHRVGNTPLTVGED